MKSQDRTLCNQTQCTASSPPFNFLPSSCIHCRGFSAPAAAGQKYPVNPSSLFCLFPSDWCFFSSVFLSFQSCNGGWRVPLYINAFLSHKSIAGCSRQEPRLICRPQRPPAMIGSLGKLLFNRPPLPSFPFSVDTLKQRETVLCVPCDDAWVSSTSAGK